MEKLEKLKAMLKELSPEEVEELKAFLNTDTEESKTEDASTANEVKDDNSVSEDKSEIEDAPAEQSSETPADETLTSVDQPAPDVKEGEDTSDVSVSTESEEKTEELTPEEQPSEENASTDESAPTDDSDEEDIPMQKVGGKQSDDDVVDNSITAEDGETLPVDYDQVIDGLQAKITALEAEKKSLEAENSALKSKVDGVFGYSAKASAPTRVNGLYDDAIDEIHFHK